MIYRTNRVYNKYELNGISALVHGLGCRMALQTKTDISVWYRKLELVFISTGVNISTFVTLNI
jgi:hypothetical protein